MKIDLRNRLVSAVCAAAMLFSAVGNTFFRNVYAVDSQMTAVTETNENNELCQQSFELHPDSGSDEQLIRLDGLMPEGAEAEAIDVSDDYDGITAYDITITDGGKEFQPDSEHPIQVEISDPAIPEDGGFELWHIRDDGGREQVPYVTVGSGRIVFSATGFSVYEIVEAMSLETVKSVDELTGDRAEAGFYLCYGANKYFTSNVNSNNALNETTDIENAAVWFFEESDNGYKMYTYVNNVKKYLHNKNGNLIELSSSGDELYISPAPTVDSFYLKHSSANKWLQHSNGGSGIRYWSDNTNATNSRIKMYYVPDEEDSLNGKSYGLMSYANGTHGYALMADSKVHTLIQLVTHQKSANESGITLYVDEGSEVTSWTFHSAGGSKYTLSAETAGGTKYLAVSGDELILADSAESASEFKTNTDSSGRIQLSCGGKYVVFSRTETSEETVEKFCLSSEADNSWINLIGFAELTDSDYITYSADRISVSDVKDGQKVIVYTRIWNEDTKRYDIYAVDYNGTLYPCYASGGKILWLGDGTSSLEWIFTEYLDEVTKEPNYYYELYNPYSEKYIAPQITGNQTLSEDNVGINMPGRRNGEFYSDIIAWDNAHYAYIGMKPDEEKKRLVPCSQSTSIPFYFATLEELNLSDRLHPVKTIDNAEHGITMKMKDFTGTSGGTGATEQNAYLVETQFLDNGAKQTKGLLSNSIDENGYPTATKSNNKYLGDLYAGAKDVNHLFVESVYNSSGYFEFDSCQNFATLKETDDGNFTVYRELGTSNNEGKSTLRHGQFFPYNNISAGNYSASNPQNLYSSDARTTNSSAGLLSEDDPRKYEPLFSAGNKEDINYYFGMEMGASFVQTVSGLDAWGHDIIFEFKGDDDFWLYVDDELVIDLGGIHSALSGKVNFRTGEVEVNGEKTTLIDIFKANYEARNETDIDGKLAEIFEDNGNGGKIFKDYTTHTMRVFYMERGAGASNLHMRFNLASVTPGHVVVSKTLSGEGADVLDKDFVEYPFQIYYTENDGEGGSAGEEKLLCNDDEHIRVTYQNSSQPVTYVRKYRPPGFSEEQAYESIYFLNPKKNAEISFPDNTISYRIVECAVDHTVYGNVMINGAEVPADRIEIVGDLRSYSSGLNSAEDRPTINFDNFVNDDVIKDLYITKKLVDENNNVITDDPATFSFRLYISSVDVSADEIPLADMYKYYVLTADKRMCRFDYDTQKFVPTSLTYSQDTVRAVEEGKVEGITVDTVTFLTSGWGSVSGIPAGYTICVPGLPVGSVFKVTEDVKSGYGLMKYECVLGEKTNADGSTEPIASYHQYDGNPANVGKVIAEESPQMEVYNKKGYGLTVKKRWSDTSITTYHEPVYTAVYVDGELLEGSVRQIVSPSTSAYYFWTTLKSKTGGLPRTGFDGYVVREVKLTGQPVADPDGVVTGYDEITPLNSGDSISLTAKRTAAATPTGESPEKSFNYVAEYEQGTEEGSSRTDTIINNREGGIAVRLFKWNSTVPLKGGQFTLTDSSGDMIGSYVSDASGIVTMLYNFEPDQLYTLTENVSPKGYIGLQKKLCFKVNTDETISLYCEDGITEWSAADSGWADWKNGQNGITAYVDVYNKSFNFKIVKTDSEDSDIKLDSAHFALYKQANTTISGYVKNKAPMTGFEDLKTVDGEVDICGGSSGRVINPGVNGAIFFLTETAAPMSYSKLEDDVIFRISPLGVPSLITNSYNGQLVETEDSYIYTLSVPNVKDTSTVPLTIHKHVNGTNGSTVKQFGFTLKVSGAAEGTEYAWSKNGDPQITPLTPDSTFTMKHDDTVVIMLPPGSAVTVTEDNGEYETTFRLGDGDAEKVNSKAFTVSGPVTLEVTNTLQGTVPTGISNTIALSLCLVLLPAFTIGYILYVKKRRAKRSAAN
ncbi:fibro-slime domain-containing protein [uncultured Ruminococcus sp.]|uniref:DUF7601 domain-containing protein n=1 Tax=uncultured Ruminococcus sp. TaxID=165186 RepID=UPI0026103140|nr:fibro-slime domain-containing protein [uncultured Ruminococcus sp.]